MYGILVWGSDMKLHSSLTACNIAFFVWSEQVQNVSRHFLSCQTLYYGKVTTSWFLELGFWLNTFLTAISECPETETVANTLWLVTNSKSCPNCKWVVCLYIIIIIIVFSLPECQWISSHVVWHKNIVTTTNFKLCCVTHTVTACKLKTLLCDTKLKNIQTANGFKPFYET